VTAGNLLRIGSRASELARTQAEWVAGRLACCTALVWIRSGGDRDRRSTLVSFGGTGIFTAALHEALFDDRIDVAVHSLKDLPAAEEAGVRLGCVPVREDPRDALVARDGHTLESLPAGARVGTGSPRRVAQLVRARPDLTFVPLRGNVGTRIGKVGAGEVDAVVLALAGLRRLGRDGEVTQVLDPGTCLPAAAQGALGLTRREDDARAQACLDALRDVEAAACTAAERAALHALGAGCHTPLGALAEVHDGRLRLRARLCSPDGATCLEADADGTLGEAAHVGARVARALLDQGAEALIAAGP
jgi:hydroxymethylbilane synthase